MRNFAKFGLSTSLRLALQGRNSEENEPLLINKLTALVVDGDRTCQMILSGLLRSFGVETICVSNGLSAIHYLASGQTFDMILIDMILPIVNGLEITRQIRAMGFTGKMLGVTACYYDRDREAFLAAGADKFIVKPLDSNRLLPVLLEIDSQL